MDEYPIDYASPVGQVRNLIADTEQLTDPANPDKIPSFYLSDKQVKAFLVTARDKIYLAASLALRAMSTNENLILKKIRTEDLQTDGPAVAGELRRMAEEFRLQQKADDEADDALDSFEIVDYMYRPVHLELR